MKRSASRTKRRPTRGVRAPSTPDAVALEVFSNALLSISEEMGALLIRTAYSINIKERHDASTAIFDHTGRLVAQAEHIPIHLGAMLSAIRHVLKRYPAETIRPGDAFLANDAYNGGGTHLADVPKGFDKLLLAGVVDARSSALEDPRELASFAARLRNEREIEQVALVPNGDLQFVSEPIAREKVLRLGAAKTATVEAAA